MQKNDRQERRHEEETGFLYVRRHGCTLPGAHCRGTTHAYTGYTVKLVMVLKRSNVEYARWEETVTAGGILLEEICNITHGHVYQVVVTAYVYNSAGKLVETQTASTGVKAY